MIDMTLYWLTISRHTLTTSEETLGFYSTLKNAQRAALEYERERGNSDQLEWKCHQGSCTDSENVYHITKLTSASLDRNHW